MAPFATAMGFCTWVEQELGWVVPSGTDEQRRKALISEAAKVKRRIAKDPALYTWDNLAVTVGWLKRRHRTVSPWAVCNEVQAALLATRTRKESTPTDISIAIIAAIDREQAERREGWQSWVRRLTRAQGAGRDDVYAEWEAERNAHAG